MILDTLVVRTVVLGVWDVGLVRGRLWGEKGGKEERGAEGGKGVAVSVHSSTNKRNLVVGSVGLVRGPRLGPSTWNRERFFFFFD